ncbi:Secretory immunoglobulin A-binding protein EsiB [Methylophilaceae bacterium]|nr:Secretory immunoglobulin A-binding protein EsiB [Methylophilaceae bacterium]
MNALVVSLLIALLLTLAGCGEKAAGNKTETTALAAQKTNVFDQFDLTPEEELKKLQMEADGGSADAQFNLAKKILSGVGVTKDAAKAAEWFRKAAVQGHVGAQFMLGVMYANGEGVPKDAAKAVEWYQKAAAQGHAKAQFNLGFMYYNGEGMPKNAAKAVEWFKKAAAQGGAEAQYVLGLMYESGEGVFKDAAKAVEWYQKAAAQGGAEAQYRLSLMYDSGEGVPKDTAKAVEWCQKAAAQGLADAQANLGAYIVGDGVSKNLVLAYAWSNLAAAQGNNIARINRDIFESQLTPAQRAEGQRLASNWKKGDTLQSSSDNGAASSDGKPIKHSTGTAFVVSNNGHALTNHHVINGCAEVKVAGREGIAKVITSDGVNDLALLQLPGKVKDIASLNPAPGKLRQGEEIIVFGYPLNSLLSSGGNLTPGIISALSGLDNNTNQIQITAPIQGGSSGSPVMDKKGNVVGVVSARLDMKAVRLTGNIPQNVNFAVNGQTVRAFLDANQVLYKTGGGLFSREKSNADIAEEARKWTVLVECWK